MAEDLERAAGLGRDAATAIGRQKTSGSNGRRSGQKVVAGGGCNCHSRILTLFFGTLSEIFR